MQISENKKQQLYGAIHEQVMTLRVKLRMNQVSADQIDFELAQLINKIWDDQKMIFK